MKDFVLGVVVGVIIMWLMSKDERDKMAAVCAKRAHDDVYFGTLLEAQEDAEQEEQARRDVMSKKELEIYEALLSAVDRRVGRENHQQRRASGAVSRLERKADDESE